jgi:hypothetical protein
VRQENGETFMLAIQEGRGDPSRHAIPYCTDARAALQGP